MQIEKDPSGEACELVILEHENSDPDHWAILASNHCMDHLIYGCDYVADSVISH